MVIGIFSVRNSRFHPNRRLIQAAGELGHRAFIVHPENCLSEINSGRLGLKSPFEDRQADVLIPRIGARISEYAMTLIRHFELMNISIVNGFQSILLAKNKFQSLQALVNAGIAVPDSYFVSTFKNFRKAVDRLGGYPVVAKTASSRQGAGVVLVQSAVTAEFIMQNLLIKGQGLLVQEFIPPHKRKDIRAFVLGSHVIAAMELAPRAKDFRSNIHLGGRASTVTLSRELAELAVKSTLALGLEISGADIVVDRNGTAKIIEVNFSAGFRGLEASSGLDIASEIIQYVSQRHGGMP